MWIKRRVTWWSGHWWIIEGRTDLIYFDGSQDAVHWEVQLGQGENDGMFIETANFNSFKWWNTRSVIIAWILRSTVRGMRSHRWMLLIKRRRRLRQFVHSAGCCNKNQWEKKKKTLTSCLHSYQYQWCACNAVVTPPSSIVGQQYEQVTWDCGGAVPVVVYIVLRHGFEFRRRVIYHNHQFVRDNRTILHWFSVGVHHMTHPFFFSARQISRSLSIRCWSNFFVNVSSHLWPVFVIGVPYPTFQSLLHYSSTGRGCS